MSLFKLSGPPKIERLDGHVFTLPYPEYDNFLRATEASESIYRTMADSSKKRAGSIQTRTNFRFRLCGLSPDLAGQVTYALEQGEFIFTPRTAKAGDTGTEQSFRVLVKNNIKLSEAIWKSLQDGIDMDIELEATAAYNADSNIGPRVLFWATAANAAGTDAPAGAICDGPGIYEITPQGQVIKRIDPGPLTISDFDIWPGGNKIVVGFTNYQLWTYNMDGSGGGLLHTVGGSTVGLGPLSVMRNYPAAENKVYVRHGTGSFAWSIQEVDLNTASLVVYFGSGSFSYPKVLCADAGKIFGVNGNTLGHVSYHAHGITAGPSMVVSNGYAGISQTPRGIIHVGDRIYFSEWNGFNWSSVADQPNQLSTSVVNHAVNGGRNHYYDPENDWVWRSGTGIIHTSSITTSGGIEVPVLYGGQLLVTAQYGTLAVEKVVPIL